MSGILVINGSARLHGNTDKFVSMLCEGVEYRQINLAGHYLSPYNYDNQYPPEDQLELIAKEILYHQHIIFATPVYWYAMSGRMKNLFDRLTDWVTTDKAIGRALKGKTLSLMAVGTDGALPDGFTVPFLMTASYMEMNYTGYQYFNVNEANTEEELSVIRKSFFSFIVK